MLLLLLLLQLSGGVMLLEMSLGWLRELWGGDIRVGGVAPHHGNGTVHVSVGLVNDSELYSLWVFALHV